MEKLEEWGLEITNMTVHIAHLPDHEFSNNKIKLTITGKVIDFNYARKIATVPDLDLANIIALDKVAKSKV